MARTAEEKKAYAKAWWAANKDKARAYSKEWKARNPEKAKAMSAESKRRNPERVKRNMREWSQKNRYGNEEHLAKKRASESTAQRVLKKYGLTPEEYAAMLVAQGGVCAVCRRAEFAVNKVHGTPLRLTVDHCHETGRVRGLLCGNCNRAAGMLRDDPVLVRALAAYLEKQP